MLNIQGIKLIVGLGNVGAEYQNTRHNAGFLLLDYLTKQLANEEMQYQQDKNFELMRFNNKGIWLLKPLTMMNASGIAVRDLLKNSNLTIANLVVAHDDLDIKLGEYKLQLAKSPKQHNGIISIEQTIGSLDFMRIRIGIENRTEQRITGMDYVLNKFTDEENKTLNTVFAKIAAEVI